MATACPALANVATVNSQFASSFPTTGTIARIVAGDTVAQQLWASIQANSTYAAALALPQQRGTAQAANTAGYNNGADNACWWSATQCKTPKRSFLPADFSTAPQRVWGTSVDDGPYPSQCHLYDLFRANNISASLFYIGGNVINNAAGAIRGYQEGHVICAHSWSHSYTTTLTNEQVFAELYYTALAIKRVLGVTTRCFRPPYGDVDDRVRTIAHALGQTVWLWTEDTDDWQVATTSVAAVNRNYASIIASASDPTGHIVLTHETSEAVTQRFIDNYPAIANAYTNGVLSAHIANSVTRPYAETNISYPDFAAYQRGARMTGLRAVTNPTAQLTLIDPDTPQTGPDPNAIATSSSVALAATSTGARASSTSVSATGTATAAAANSTGTSSPLAPATRNAIIGASAGGVVLLIAIIVLWRCLSRRSHKAARRQSAVAHRLAHRDISSPRPEYAEKHSLTNMSSRPLPPGAGPSAGGPIYLAGPENASHSRFDRSDYTINEPSAHSRPTYDRSNSSFGNSPMAYYQDDFSTSDVALGRATARESTYSLVEQTYGSPRHQQGSAH